VGKHLGLSEHSGELFLVFTCLLDIMMCSTPIHKVVKAAVPRNSVFEYRVS
jgi:hypothetical protein